MLRAWLILRDCARGKPRDTNSGICGNLGVRLKSKILIEIFKSWEHFSGSARYPIKIGEHPLIDFNNALDSGTLWEFRTEYGSLRQDLCRHVMLELEKRSFLCKLASKLCPIE